MSTATKKKRRPRKEKVGAEAWQIVGPDGEVLRETGHGAEVMLSIAQNDIQMYDEPIALEIRLQPLFGEPDVFYRVVLDEDGVVSTWRS